MSFKWNPFRDLIRLPGWRGTVVESLLPGWEEEEWRLPGLWSPVRSWMPAVDVSEDEKNLYIEAELPEIDMKEIDIAIEGDTLRIKGEKKGERERKGKNYFTVERTYGGFSRSFTLPQYVNAEKATATYEKGVLKIAIPKKEEARPRMIPIHVKG